MIMVVEIEIKERKGGSLEEEEFYGGGKGERDPRRKEKEGMILMNQKGNRG